MQGFVEILLLAALLGVRGLFELFHGREIGVGCDAET
jgi:hypothetical protein